ncbi:glycoside hydrolase family 18 protein [Pedobacter insulae]|uniref:chitinase n=1 Tax=Pedobacter insulae TaxID=414048 RepID=A0A1I2V231_9SPHI|nr:glycoside hydrolase family 18 protein [Pedobacter insulae]SFG83200.1 chitinase [Pedobacter insulae]
MSKLRNGIATICLMSIVFFGSLGMKKPDQKPVVIGYVVGFNGLINAETIDATQLTHINYAFVNIKNNEAHLEDYKRDVENFKRLNTLKQKNPSLQLLISIGGWAWSENFSDAVLTDSLRKRFAVSAVNLIREHQLDGVDIDWEYPGIPGEEGNVYRKEDEENFTLMFKELRKELDILAKETGKKKLLTTATGGFTSFLDQTDMGKAQQYLDFVNLMTYDYYPNKVACHHTNLYASKSYPSVHSADKAIKAYINAGVPASKIVIGLAFYGRNLTLSPSAQKGLGDSIVSMVNHYGKGFTFLKDSLINQKGFVAYKDEDAKAPFMFNAGTKQFISYDNEWSVAHKCEYVLQHKLGGVMFWEYHSDKKGYLLNQITKSFR